MKSLLVLLCLTLGSVFVTAQTNFSQGQPIVVGTGGLLSSGLYRDASQFTSGTIGTCTPGTNDDVCIGNAIQAIAGTPASGGGYGIIDATALSTSGQTWAANPFASIVSNGTTNFTAPQKCGELWLNGGTTITESQPFVIPQCWIVRWKGGHAPGVQNLQPSSSWPSVHTTGTVTTAAGTGSPSQFTVTGSGTAFASQVTDGAMTASSQTLTSATAAFTSGDVGTLITVQGAGAGGHNLYTQIAAFVSSTQVTLFNAASTTVSGATVAYRYVVDPGGIFAVCTSTITGASCGGTTGSVSYGIILAVNSSTSLIVGCNNTSNCTANSSGADYVTYSPLLMLGTFGQTGSDAGGVWEGVENGTLSCGNKSGCGAVIANYSQQENTFVDGMIFNNFVNIGLDLESNSFNSGPYSRLIFNGSSSVGANTMAIVNRVLPSASTTRKVGPFTIAFDSSPTNEPSFVVDWECGGGCELGNGHYENTGQSGGTTINFVALGDNSGGGSQVTCPIICLSPPNNIGGAWIHDLNTTGNGNTGIVIGSAANAKFILTDDAFGPFANAFNDQARNCTQTSTSGDGNIEIYWRSQNGTWGGSAGAGANSCANQNLGYFITAAMTQQTTANITPLKSGRSGSDGVTNGTTTFTSATAAFTSADIGQSFTCIGCGAAAANLITTIASVTNGTTVVLATAATSSASGQTWYFSFSFPLTASKYYKLRCEIPIAFAASATVSFGFVGPSNPTTYDISFWGNTAAAGAFQEVDAVAQTTWTAGTTLVGPSGAPAGAAAKRIHLEASINNSANNQTVTLGTVADGTHGITVSGRSDCTVQQLN